MTTIDLDAYICEVIRFTERISDEIGLLRKMLQVLREDETYDRTGQDNGTSADDTVHVAADGRADQGESVQ